MNSAELQEKLRAMAGSSPAPEPGKPVVPEFDNWYEGLNRNQQQALNLLGQGISSVMVSSTLGISEGLVSQYLANPRFAHEVTKRKLVGLQMQTGIDHKYMEAENKLVDKLLKVIPLMTKPMDILKGLQTVNATKRRGMADGAPATAVTQIVQINLPASMAAKFITNGANQIVEIQDEDGATSLVTAPSGQVSRLAHEAYGGSEETIGLGGQTTTAKYLIEQASQRLNESALREIKESGLGKSITAKSQITADDL